MKKKVKEYARNKGYDFENLLLNENNVDILNLENNKILIATVEELSNTLLVIQYLQNVYFFSKNISRSFKFFQTSKLKVNDKPIYQVSFKWNSIISIFFFNFIKLVLTIISMTWNPITLEIVIASLNGKVFLINGKKNIIENKTSFEIPKKI